MPAKIPYDRWSWKHDKCLICGTTSKQGRSKHEAKGLCQRCHKREECARLMEKRRAMGIMPKKKWTYKNYWQSIKDNPERVKKYYEQINRLRKNGEWYQRHLKTRWARAKYKKFIKDWFENRELCDYGKMGKGLILNLEYGNREFLIITPLKRKHLDSHHLDVFRKEFERYMKKIS